MRSWPHVAWGVSAASSSRHRPAHRRRSRHERVITGALAILQRASSRCSPLPSRRAGPWGFQWPRCGYPWPPHPSGHRVARRPHEPPGRHAAMSPPLLGGVLIARTEGHHRHGRAEVWQATAAERSTRLNAARQHAAVTVKNLTSVLRCRCFRRRSRGRRGRVPGVARHQRSGKSTLLRAISGVVEPDHASCPRRREITHAPPNEIAPSRRRCPAAKGCPDPHGRRKPPRGVMARPAPAGRRPTAWPGIRAFPLLANVPATTPGTSRAASSRCRSRHGLTSRPKMLLIDELSLGLAPAVAPSSSPRRRRPRAGTTVVLVEQSVHIAPGGADRGCSSRRAKCASAARRRSSSSARTSCVRSSSKGRAAGFGPAARRRGQGAATTQVEARPAGAQHPDGRSASAASRRQRRVIDAHPARRSASSAPTARQDDVFESCRFIGSMPAQCCSTAPTSPREPRLTRRPRFRSLVPGRPVFPSLTVATSSPSPASASSAPAPDLRRPPPAEPTTPNAGRCPRGRAARPPRLDATARRRARALDRTRA